MWTVLLKQMTNAIFFGGGGGGDLLKTDSWKIEGRGVEICLRRTV